VRLLFEISVGTVTRDRRFCAIDQWRCLYLFHFFYSVLFFCVLRPSSSSNLLQVFCSNLIYGFRSFCAAAPTISNPLPDPIRSSGTFRFLIYGRFVRWTILPLDVSPLNWMFCHLDISPPAWTFYPILVLGNTAILLKYRNTHFRRYQYHWGDDTFWYRDTCKYRDTAAILTK